MLSVGFVPPVKTMSAGTGIPLVGLNPRLDITGGTLTGFETLYYGIAAVDSAGAESDLSFMVKAAIPAGTNTNRVTIQSLSFSSSSAAFSVYRGRTPSELLQIAAAQPIAAQFVDNGLTPTLIGPPDVNYDHANFYWRLELQPEEPVDIH